MSKNLIEAAGGDVFMVAIKLRKGIDVGITFR